MPSPPQKKKPWNVLIEIAAFGTHIPIKKPQLPTEKKTKKKGFWVALCSELSQETGLVTESHHSASHGPVQITAFCSDTCPKDSSRHPPILPKLQLPSLLRFRAKLPGPLAPRRVSPPPAQTDAISHIHSPWHSQSVSPSNSSALWRLSKTAAAPAPGAEPTLLNADGGLGLPLHL